MMGKQPSRLGAARIALLAAGAIMLAGAAEPARPPVPEEKPMAATKDQKPVPPPDKGEAAPVPKTRPPESEGGAKAVPEERPAHETEPEKKPGAEQAAPPSPEQTPAPKARPDKHETKTPPGKQDGAAEPEGPKHVEEPAIIPTPGVHEDQAALEACYHDLDALGVIYSKETMINDPGVCGIEKPISVTRILPDVTLEPTNRMRCATALALARWTKAVVKPSAEALGTDVQLTGLSHGSAYVCKLRNSADHGKISEHAFGSAIDIVTFQFSHHDPISIEPRNRTGKIEEGFQRAVIGGACLYFTTVLGPHADVAHEDNLHLDVMERRSGFRLCE